MIRTWQTDINVLLFFMPAPYSLFSTVFTALCSKILLSSRFPVNLLIVSLSC